MAGKADKAFVFQVDESSDVPLWVQLKNRMAYLITTGYYEPGEQLPTVRALATEISINYNTVNKAYLALKSEGYIEATRGRGAFVRDVDAEVDQEFSQQIDAILDDCVAACRDLGLSPDDIRRCMDAKIRQVNQAEGIGVPGENATGRIITIKVGPALQGGKAGA